MKRGFEIVSSYTDKNITLPKRATTKAAGYDFEAAEDIVIPTIWKAIFKTVAIEMKQWFHQTIGQKETDEQRHSRESVLKPILVPTGIKAYMQEDEYLQLTNRSSNPLKNFLILTNGVGVVDADYYNNEANEGHIYFQMSNFGLSDKVIKKGERIGQGIFLPFLKADIEDSAAVERIGGFGSSGVESLKESE